MTISKNIRITLVTCLVAVLAFAMIGCTPVVTEDTTKQTANRQFMSDVNQAMETISTDLSGFGEALSQEDVVSMKTQVTAASKSIGDLEKIEAPEGLGEIKQGYVDGCKKLQEALDQYLALYVEISEGSFDYATYDTRIDDIKKIYEGGIQLLEDTDKKATELE